MKYLKTYETFNENIIKIGDILKIVNTIDNEHYNLFLITNCSDTSREIEIFYFATTTLDFDYTNFKALYLSQKNKLNRWFINDYSFLTDEETNILYKQIEDLDDDYYFEKVEELSNINLKNYPIKKDVDKYNL